MNKTLTLNDVWPLFCAYCQLPGNTWATLELFDDLSGRVTVFENHRFSFHNLEDLRVLLTKETAT